MRCNGELTGRVNGDNLKAEMESLVITNVSGWFGGCGPLSLDVLACFRFVTFGRRIARVQSNTRPSVDISFPICSSLRAKFIA
jgi:hypothetical protein